MPTDNPFYDGSGPNYDSIWALGLRNPYRAYYDAPTDRLIIGDVGGNDDVDGDRGGRRRRPRGELRLAQRRRPVQRALHRARSTPTPHNGRDSAVTGGFVYHGDQFPSGYKGSYFFADYTQNWIKRLTFDANGKVNGVFNFEPPTATTTGPTATSSTWSRVPRARSTTSTSATRTSAATFGVSKLRRIRYISGNQPPIASAAANPSVGPGAADGQLLQRGLDAIPRGRR